MLKPFQSFGRNRALDLRTVGKAESEKLSFLRSRYRALALIHLEFELLRDESRDAFPSLVDPRARCERRCCCRQRSEHSDVPGAPTHGRVRRGRGWTAVAKVDLLVGCLPHWG